MKKLNVKLISLLISMLVGVFCFGQKNSVRMSGGIGASDFAHLGVDYQYAKKFKIGIARGFFANNQLDEDADNRFKARSYSLNNYYLFGASKKFENNSTWYVKQSVILWDEKQFSKERYQYFWLGLDIGRSLNVAPGAAFNIELVAMYNLYNQTTDRNGGLIKNSNGGSLHPDIPLFVAAQLQLVIRLYKR